MQDQYVQVDEVKTRYWKLGGQGTALILLHGLGGHVELWHDNIVALGQYHQVYAVDMVGCGYSDKPKISYSLDSLAQFIKDFMNVLGIERASLIGCSMGGGVALQFALMFPEKLEKLVLISSIGLGTGTTPLFRLIALPFVGEFLTRLTGKLGITWLFKQVVYDPILITEKMVQDSYQISVKPGFRRAYLALIRTNAQYFGVSSQDSNPILDKLGTITTPTFVIWGQQDSIIPVAHAYIAANNLLNNRLHIFPYCKHWPAREHLKDFNALVLDFLSID